MRITYMQSGGFAGLIRGCAIDTAHLAPDQRQEVESLVAACGDVASTASLSGADRDLRQIDLVIEQHGPPRRLRCAERSVPEAARPLVAFLATRARPQPPGFAEAFGDPSAEG